MLYSGTRLLQFALRGVQYVAANVANLRHRTDAVFSHTGVGDLYKAWQVAQLLPPSDGRLLDVGCGRGRLIQQIQLFKQVNCLGVDLQVPSGKPHLSVYDGRELPFESGSFDAVVFGYVLHHLSRAHATALVTEALRVLRGEGKLILLEDSLASIGPSYRLRNWAHFIEAGLEYAGRSKSYRAPRRPEMFLNHAGWRSFLASFPGVTRVDITPLAPQFTYKHHTLICAHLG